MAVRRAAAGERYVFFFNDTGTPEIYTLSLHDALPISRLPLQQKVDHEEAKIRDLYPLGSIPQRFFHVDADAHFVEDRKSTRLNSSHSSISYAVFCLKKKTKPIQPHVPTRYQIPLHINK